MTLLSRSEEQKTNYHQINYDNKISIQDNDSYLIDELITKNETVSSDYLNGKTAVISGAGIAGLAAAFELKAKGYEVVIVERRKDFSRYNTINLSKEIQFFLKKFHLLEEFEASVAARINNHQLVVISNGNIKSLGVTDVSKQEFEGSLNNDPITFDTLFNEDGIYSVQIKELQAFLAQKVSKLGVKILSDSEIIRIKQIVTGRVSEIVIKKKGSPSLTLEPDLFFIAEGARSTSVGELGMDDPSDEVVNACTDENWIFGNLKYEGDKTFVVSMILTSQKTVQIANVIFNARSQIMNVAVTSDENPIKDDINHLINDIAQKAFVYAGIPETPVLINTLDHPIRITNRIASVCSKDNVFRIGDAAGNSSPLAGLGGTLGLSLVPLTVAKLLSDLENLPENQAHQNFKTFSQAYVNKWIGKSKNVKEAIQGIFEKDQNLKVSLEDHTQSMVTHNET